MNNFSFNPRAIKGLLFLSILGGLGASQAYADDGADLAQQFQILSRTWSVCHFS